MKIEILHIDDCPNSDEVGVRVRDAVTAVGLSDVDIVSTLLLTSEDAAGSIFAGSPTVVVNGIDAFPSGGRTSDLACRIYPTVDGFAGLPTTEQLIEVLRERTSAPSKVTDAREPDSAHDAAGLAALSKNHTALSEKPTVLFVCVHNAGRSQMAAGYLRALSGGQVDVLSAGSEPKDQINPVAIQAMSEEGIDIADGIPRVLTTEAVRDSDVVITMGCGDACPIFPGKRYEDWQLDDPAGQGIDAVRAIRDDIKQRIERLLAELIGN